MTDEELKAIEERASKATPGRWDYNDCWGPDQHVLSVGSVKRALVITEPNSERNADFLEYAREDVMRLVAEVRQLRGTIHALLAVTIDEDGSCQECGNGGEKTVEHEPNCVVGKAMAAVSE